MMQKRIKKRNVILLSGMFAMLLLGTSYWWSIFQYHLVNELNWSPSLAVIPFTIMNFLAPLGGIIGGRITDKIGPKAVMRVMGIGAMGLGMFSSGVTVVLGPIPFACSFLLFATGQGAVYNCILPTVQLWFPDKRGFAMGCVVSCAGAAGIIFSPYAEFLLVKLGIQGAFFAIGITYSVVILVSSFFFDKPSSQQFSEQLVALNIKPNNRDFTTKEMLKSSAFLFLTVSMACSILPNLILSPRIKDLIVDNNLSVTFATATVMLCSLSSTGGRFLGSWIADHLGVKKTIVILNLITLISMTILCFAEGFSVALICAVITFSFGGYLSTFPMITGSLFGLSHLGTNFGFVMISTSLAAIVAPLIADAFWNTSSSSLTFVISAISSAVAIILIFLLNSHNSPKEASHN